MTGRGFMPAVLVLALVAGCSDGPSDEDAPRDRSAAAQASASAAHPSAAHPPPPEPLARSHIQPEVRVAGGNVRNVFIRSRNVTKFTRPRHIYKAEVSPDGRYLLVWHLAYPPREVSVYDLENHQRMCNFVPGAGGELRWAAQNLIYHQYGAGTNTASFVVYDVNGQGLWEGFTSGACLCGSGRYVFVVPSLPQGNEDIQVLDVRDGDVLARTRPPDFARVFTQTWLDGRTVRFWYETLEGQTRSVDLPLTPESPQP